MSVVDTLNVLVTADSKKFVATMNGVVKQTEVTQGSFDRMYAAGVKGTLQFTKALVAGTAITAGFGLAVSKMGEQLQKYGADVPASTIKAFDQMDAAMEEAGKTISIAVGGALAAASDGFIIFTKTVADTITNSAALKKLFEGLNYVFAIVGESIKSVGDVLNVVINGFQTMILSVELATTAMDQFFEGSSPEKQARIDDLKDKIRTLGEETKASLSDAFDFNRFVTSIEKVYALAAEKEAARQKMLQEGTSRQLSYDALTDASLRKRQVELARTTDALYVQSLVEKKILEDSALFGYEVESKRVALAQQGTKERLDNAVWEATREEQIGQMKRQGMQSIRVQEAQDEAQMQALWESSWKGKSQILGSILGNLSTLMDTHSKKMFKIGKAAAIADAIVNALLAANKAYQSLAGIPYVGPALGAAAAAAALAAGYANVSRIKSTQFGGGGGGGGGSAAAASSGGTTSTGATPAAAMSSSSNVNVTLIGDRYSQSQVRGLIGQINDAAGDNASVKVTGGF